MSSPRSAYMFRTLMHHGKLRHRGRGFLFLGGCMKWVRLHEKRLDSVSAGESAVPEFHRSPLLLFATSHLLLSGTSLSHDAAGETPTVFRLEVWTEVYKAQTCVRTSTGTAVRQIQLKAGMKISYSWPPGPSAALPPLMNSRRPEEAC